jgi:hypothetical protein
MCPVGPACLNALPLEAQPITLWSKSGDLFTFLTELYDDNGEIIDESGSRSAVNYRDYGDTLYEQGRLSFLNLAAEFQTLAPSASTPRPRLSFRLWPAAATRLPSRSSPLRGLPYSSSCPVRQDMRKDLVSMEERRS